MRGVLFLTVCATASGPFVQLLGAQPPAPGAGAAPQVTRVATLPHVLTALAYGEDSLWMLSRTAGPTWSPQQFLNRVDPDTGTTLASIPLDGTASALAVGEGSAWVLSRRGGTTVLSRIDARTNRVAADLPLGPSLLYPKIVVGAGSVWVCGQYDFPSKGKVVRIDPGTNRVAATIPTEEPSLAMAAGEGAVWVLCGARSPVASGREVLRIDPGSNRVTASIPVSRWTADVVAGEGRVWLLESDAGLALWLEAWRVRRLDPGTGQPVGEPVVLPGQHLHGSATGMGGLWVCQSRNQKADTLYRIDAQTLQLTELPAAPSRGLTTAIAVGGGAVWSTTYQGHGGTPLNRVQP